jgi:hypothetical protein
MFALNAAIFLSQVPPGGDLLLIKDVLQHLSNHSVQEFLEKVLPRYRYALITNDIARYEERRFWTSCCKNYHLWRQTWMLRTVVAAP